MDIVHAFDVPTALFAVPLARAARVPAVLSSQRGDRRLFPKPFQHGLRLTDRLSDVVVVNSTYVRGILETDFGVPRDKVCTCPNGIDLEVFRPDGPSHRSVFPSGALVVGVVAALRPEKAVATLIDAVARLHVRAVQLVIVGGGACQAALRAQAEAAGLGDRCTFVPGTAAVAPWYRTLDVFVLPSLNESFSNSLMEAMACGCAVVASNVGGNPELVRDGVNGLLFTTADAPDLARRLEVLLHDAWARRRLAQAAAETIEREYGNRRSTLRFTGLYHEVLGRAAARGARG